MSKEKKNRNFFIYIFRVLFVITVIILLYIIVNFVKLFSRDGVKVYEVTNGEIVNVDRHKGFIFRDENIATCQNDGYINFYVANSDKVNRGAFIYTINDTENVIKAYDLNDKDRQQIKQNIKMYVNTINDFDFSSVYYIGENLNNMINDINIIKQLENIDVEKEIDAKEKGYAKYAGLVSFAIDGYENEVLENYNEDFILKYDGIKLLSQKNEVLSGDAVYKIIKNSEFSVAFDSTYDYDNYNKSNFVQVKFVNENLTTNATIDSFIGTDGKKHFKLKLNEYPERFLDKRVVEFEIENKKVNGYKIPIKSITSKNCYKIPKTIFEKDLETNEDFFYKIGINGEKNKIYCNISKEDNDYYYISIDDTLSNLKFGDVISNRYNDNYSLSEIVKLEGVYNMNKGYAAFKNVDIIDRTNEYAIIRKQTTNGISLYDHIALNASEIKEGDLIS